MDNIFRYITIYKAHWIDGAECYSDMTLNDALNDFFIKFPEEECDSRSIVIQVDY